MSKCVKKFFRLPLLLSLFIVVSIFLSGCTGEEEESPQQRPAMPVGVQVIKSQNVLTTVELPGRTSAYYLAEVRPQVSGIIRKRMFQEGSTVKAGQQLYQIDPDMYQAAYETAVANQKKAEAQLDSAKSLAMRYAEIIKSNAVSKQDYDDAMVRYRQAQADLASSKAAVKTAKINLDYTKVFSPVSGRVGISTVTEGALVTASQPTPLIYVQQLNPMYIDIVQSSTDFLSLQRSLKSGKVKDGGDDSVNVQLILEDGLPYEYTAKLMLYDVTVEQSTGSITMRATVENPDGLLLPGMFVRAIVSQGITENALLVPLQAVQRTPKGEPYVLVVNKDNIVEQRLFSSNRTKDGAWIVMPGVINGTGLMDGEQIIMEGSLRVRPGMPVSPVPYVPGGQKPQEEAKQ